MHSPCVAVLNSPQPGKGWGGHKGAKGVNETYSTHLLEMEKEKERNHKQNKTKQKSKTKNEGFTKILYKKYTMKRNNNKANSDTIIKTQKF